MTTAKELHYLLQIIPLNHSHNSYFCRWLWNKINRTACLQDFGVFTSSAVVLFQHCYSVGSCCLSGRFWVAGRDLVIHIKWLFNGATSIWLRYWGCEGGGWRFSCQTRGNLNEAQGLLPQTFHWGGKLKREEKLLVNNSCLSHGGPLHWLQFLISCLQFSRNFFYSFFFFSFFFTSALKPATAALSPLS